MLCFYFKLMAAITVKNENDGRATPLKTEGSLTEKDQQGQAIELQRSLAEQALAKWRQLKEKIKDKFKK